MAARRCTFAENCPVCNRTFIISKENCEYRGEGNSSLVVRLKGEGKVIRILKNETKKENGVTVDINDIQKRLELQTNFTKHVMKPLLGDLVLNPIMICLSAKEIRRLNRNVENCRPGFRKHRKVKEVPTYASLLPDFCFMPDSLTHYQTVGPVLGVEIKPKQGFLMASEDFLLDSQPRLSVCRYCLKQHYRWKEGAIKVRSRYCPLDLFSGCPVRMHRAIGELLKTPNNNLRIFYNQELAFSGEKRAKPSDVLSQFYGKSDCLSVESNFQSMVVQSLLTSFPMSEEMFDLVSTSKTEFCDNVQRVACPTDQNCRHSLPSGSVLDRILRVQQLGQADVSQVYPYWKEFTNRLLISNYGPPPNPFISQTSNTTTTSSNTTTFPPNPTNTTSPSTNNTPTTLMSECPNYPLAPATFQPQIVDSYPQSRLPEHIGKENRQPGESGLHYKKRKVWEFLVSLTAKDCSIILVMQKILDRCNAPPYHVIYDSRGDPYLFSIAVIDMDPKPLRTVEKVFRDNSNIVQAYLASNAKEFEL